MTSLRLIALATRDPPPENEHRQEERTAGQGQLHATAVQPQDQPRLPDRLRRPAGR
jgi:hypothetical protein